MPMPDTKNGYWERVGKTRRSVLKNKKNARLADSLICQFCLDHKLGLITRDSDFKNFAKVSGLIIL